MMTHVLLTISALFIAGQDLLLEHDDQGNNT